MQQARHPWFYTAAAIPDSFDGRFEMLVLHLFAYLESDAAHQQNTALRQALLEYMLDDMDRTLREMGVGDMGVSRRIKQMGSALNGRLQIYAAAMQQPTPALQEALKRNAYGTVEESQIADNAVSKLASYTAALVQYLQTGRQQQDLRLQFFSLPD